MFSDYTSFFDEVIGEIADSLKNSDYSFIVSSNLDGVKDINAFSKADVPYNQYVDEEKNLYFDFALAGVSKDSIELTKTGKIIEILVNGTEDKNKFAYTHKGIKFPKENGVSIATIEVTDKYNDTPFISFSDGLLKLKFEIKPEEKAVKLPIA